MAVRKSDGSYDLRYKEGREAKKREEDMAAGAKFWEGFFRVIFTIIALPFKLVWRLIKRR